MTLKYLFVKLKCVDCIKHHVAYRVVCQPIDKNFALALVGHKILILELLELVADGGLVDAKNAG